MWRKGLLSFGLGLLLFGSTEAAWLIYVEFVGSLSRWVLEPNPGVVAGIAIHFAGAIAFSAAFRPNAAEVVSFGAGIGTAVVIALFIVGPGNLWPIVLVIDAVFLGAPLLAGVAIGRALRRLVRTAA